MRTNLKTLNRAFCLTLAGGFILLSQCAAQLPLTRLSTIFPAGGKIASTIDVEVTGLDFEELSGLTFSHPGITAKAKEGAPNHFLVNIAADVPAGSHEVWLNGRFGSSNPRVFAVGTQEERTDPGSINSPDKAMDLPLNTVFNGRTDANLADWFKLTLKQGQQVVLECQGPEIDSRIQPSMVLLDSHQQELKRNRLGELIDFTAPADGVYIAKVHDFLFRGGGEFFYRFVASTAPHLDFALPPMGAAGAKQKITLYGRNLPGSKPSAFRGTDGVVLEQLDVEIQMPTDSATARWSQIATAPASGPVDGFDYRLPSPQGLSNPLFIGFATGPIVAEMEPNNDPAKPQMLTLPCEVAGQFHPERDRDWYRFNAKKGEAWWIELFAHRLGLNCNPYLLIQRVVKDAKGVETGADIRDVYDNDTNLGGREFNTANRDPVTRFEVPEDGSYRILVRGLFNQSHDNPALVYRLSIRKDAPDFRLVAMADSPPPIKGDQRNINISPAAIRKADSLPVNIYAFRHDGFNGEIALVAEGLPAGLHAGAAVIEAGKNSGQLILTADEGAAVWNGKLKIVGKAKIGDAELTRVAGGAALEWNVGDWNAEPVFTRLSSSVPLSVLAAETAPLSIVPSENKPWEKPENTKIDIPLKIIRRADFGAAFKLKAMGLGALEKLPEIDVDGKATNATFTIDLAKFKLPAGTHTLYLRTQTTGKYRNNPEGATAADAESKAAEKVATDTATAAKSASDALAAAAKAADEAAKQAQSASAKDKASIEARAKTTLDAKTAAEKASTEAAARAKQAADNKVAAAARAKAANEKAKPQDVTIMAYSPTITLVITPTPKAPAPAK